MNKLQRKLRSRAGASMILALLFLMFCSFVGGSVLVSATANAYRVAHLEEQQDFLNQRSAALLLAEELRIPSGKYLKITVTDEDVHIQEMKWTDEGARHAEPTSPDRCYDERTVTFRIETNGTINEVQRLMLEMTIWRYLVAEAKKETSTAKFTVVVENLAKTNTGADVQIPGFHYSYIPTHTSKISLDPSTPVAIECELDVSAQLNGNVSGIDVPPVFTARCTSGSGADLYDFFVDVGEDSVMKLTMKPGWGKKTVDDNVTYDPEAGTVPGLVAKPGYPLTNLVQITRTKTQTDIEWNNPAKIEKGGA